MVQTGGFIHMCSSLYYSLFIRIQIVVVVALLHRIQLCRVNPFVSIVYRLLMRAVFDKSREGSKTQPSESYDAKYLDTGITNNPRRTW
jgi:hypothetical protein